MENDSLNTERRMYWDEDNRLMVLSDNGKTSRYTYNAAGERIVKSHGDLEGVYVNGAPQGITFHETEDYTIYPAPIITVTKNRFTKHYFIGDKRIASKLGTGKFSNVYGISSNNVTAGQKDYAARMMQIEKQREDYYRKLGTPPGVPTMKGATADPDNTGYGYNTIIGELGDHSVPEGWVQRPKFNKKGDVPGPPIQWNKPEDPDNAQPGYGYVPTDTTNTEEIFFYHSDHLGSTSYITDAKANITQFDAYLPYGELLVDEHSSSEEMPYKFNGKEFDGETGLYYYGARYMNPRTSLWYGVDPLAEKYPEIGGYINCHCNPIMRVDIDGMDDYALNSEGKMYFWRKTDARTTHRVFSGKKSITVNKTLVNQLVSNATLNGTSATISDSEDAFKFFKFAADNTKVEWHLVGVKDKRNVNFIIRTDFSTGGVGVDEEYYANMIFHLHNHPWGSNDFKKGTRASGDYKAYKRVASGERVANYYTEGDVWTLNNIYIGYNQAHPNTALNKYPKAYIFYSGDKRQRSQLYQFDLNSPRFNPIYNPTYKEIKKYIYKK